MRNFKFRRAGYSIFGCVCIALGLQRIITGEYRTDSNPVRSGMSIDGFPAVMIGIPVLVFGCYILDLSVTEEK